MYNSKKLKVILLLLCISTLTANEPTSPDFSGYTAVGNNQIVNKFTGSLNYSIPIVVVPGPDGSDYEIALTYTSGVQPDQQASWVGYGWSLSPGAITRQKKGFPDDYNNQKIKYWQKFRESLTASKNVMVRTELLSVDEETKNGATATVLGPLLELGRKIGLSANYSRSTTLNNYSGYSVQTSLGVGAGAFGSLSATWNQKGVPTYFYDLNLVALLQKYIAMTDENPSNGGTRSFSEQTLGRLENQAVGLVSAGYSTSTIYSAITSKGSGKFPSSTSEFTGSQKTFAPTFGLSLGFLKIEGEPGLTITEIIQKPLDEQPLIKKGFGYINSNKAKDNKDIMDYYTENQSEFTKDDQFLPIPFSNADNFHVTCKDLSGSFRAWSRFVEEYRPNEVKSESISNSFGLTLVVGPSDASVNIGVGYGDGGSKSVTNGWMSNNYNLSKYIKYPQNSIPQYYFKFHNDLGQSNSFYSNGVSLGDIHSPEALDVVDTTLSLAALSFYNRPFIYPTNNSSVKFNKSILSSHNSILRQSKDIAYNSNEDLFYDNKNIRRFSKISKYLTGVDDDIITEFKIVNEDGKKFIFGLPVFSRNEKNLSYGIEKIKNSTNSDKMAYTINGKIIFQNITPEKDDFTQIAPKVILGQEMDAPYVGSYLVTEILSSNYIDINNDGPSKDDIGGYTVFDYERVYGSDNKKEGIDYKWDAPNNDETKTSNWYKWRVPVSGFNYDKNSQSDRGDDLISFSSGEKEVYNLEAISTKSHVAIFVNNESNISLFQNGILVPIQNSGVKRKDSYESFHSEWKAGSSTTADISSENNIRNLERIELWKLDELQPIKYENGKKYYNVIEKLQTTHFVYDYSAWNELPDSELGEGKLTLKKVWTESGDNKSDYQTPYTFGYESDYASYPTYAGITPPTTAKEETPTYDILDIDAWGNYRKDNISGIDKGRYFQEQFGVFQNNKFYIGSTYDPSAWNLKQIKLPSTGSIFIDYEENEYTRVQDENPMAMLSIADDGYDEVNHKIKLNVFEDLGLDVTIPAESLKVQEIVNLIHKKYVSGDEKIYFNFLYSLVGPEVYNDISNCSSEYIDGFIGVYLVELVGNEIVITLKNSEGVFLPRQICKDYFYSTRYGIYNPNSNQEPPCCKTKTGEREVNYTGDNIESIKDKLGSMISGSNSFNTDEDDICKNINVDLSYIRIPLPESFSKKGGGIRVKRILYLDKFDLRTGESGALARMYGNEYIYENTGGTSSGVAANEPQSIVKENPFYKPIVKRNSTSIYSAGNQVSNLLGPFGTSIMPSASIGYSRVMSKSIIDNENHPGFTIDSFLTYKDYPVFGLLSNNTDDNSLFSYTGDKYKEFKGFSWTSLKDTKKRFIRDPGFVFPSPYVSLSSLALVSQGFQFITHNYNGKPVKSLTYGGRYDNPDTWNLGSSTIYEYFRLGEEIPYIDEKFRLQKGSKGRDVEIIMEGKFTQNTTKDWKAEGDLSFILSFPPVIKEVGGFGGYSTFSKTLGTHTTNKIINYPAITKKIITTADGVTTVKENTAFDINTGQPFITRINDKFSKSDRNDSYYQVMDIPTSYIYDEFSQKAQGQVNVFLENHMMNGAIIRKIRINQTPNLYFISMDSKPYGDYSFEFINHFSTGDLIEVSPSNNTSYQSNSKEYYRIQKVLSDVLVLEPIISGNIESLKNSDLHCNIKIIDSGKRNQLNSKAAKIVKRDTLYLVGNNILENESYNSFMIDNGVSNIPNYNGINSICSAINSKLNSIFDGIFSNSYPNHKNTYIQAIDSNWDYSLPIHIMPSTGNLTSIEPINITGSMVNTNYFDLNGEVKPLTVPTITIEDVKFKLGVQSNYSKYCQENYLNIAFDVCWEREEGEEITYVDGVQPHKFTEDLNDILNKSWHIELSDILIKYGLYDKIRYIDEENIFHPYISKSFVIDEDIRESFWEDVSKKIGLSSLNENNYGLLDEKGSEYLRILDKEKLYIISYKKNSNSLQKIYFSDFYLKNIQKVDGMPSVKNIEFGFARNIARINDNPFFEKSPIYSYTPALDTKSYNKFIIQESSLINTNMYEYNSNEILFELINSSNNHPFSSNGMYYTIVANNDDTDLILNYTDNVPSLSSVTFSSNNILPLNLLPDKCCRTYLATFNRNSYQITDINTALNPFDVLNHSSSKNYFGNRNGQISDLELSGKLYCAVNEDTIRFEGATALEANEFCIRFAPEEDLVYKLKNVYAATVADYKDDWDNDKLSTFFDNSDEYSVGKKGRWTNHKSYVYKNPIDHGTAFTGSAKNTLNNKGLLQHYNASNDFINHEYKDFILFNWKIPQVNDDLRWISQSEITSVNDLNQPEEEQSVIGLKSSVFYSESDLKPILYVNNSNKNEIFYSSGDCNIPTQFSDGPNFGKPHTGNDLISFLSPMSSYELDADFKIEFDKTYLLKYWIYHYDGIPLGIPQALEVKFFNTATNSDITTSFIESSNWTNPIRVGNWDLITHEIKVNTYSPPSTNEINIKVIAAVPTYIDDLLFIPIDATSKCIAYNCENDRVEAEFDSEHFATFFDYDNEGRLIRKRKETYRGVKNIAETYYNTPKVDISGSSGYEEGIITPKKTYDQEMYQPNNNLNNEIELKGGSSQKEQGNKFDIFDLKIDKDGINSKLFNTDTEKIIENLDSLKKKVKGFKIDSLKKEFNLDQLGNTKEIENKFNAKYNEIDSLKIPELQMDTTGIQDKINGRIESEVIKNGNHNTKIRKGK